VALGEINVFWKFFGELPNTLRIFTLRAQFRGMACKRATLTSAAVRETPMAVCKIHCRGGGALLALHLD
jgi:hypothetical protein